MSTSRTEAPRRRMRITVVGCGRLGALLADQLSAGGHEVVVVDTDPAAFDRLAPGFGGFRVVGNAAEIATLREARAAGADVVLATTRDDPLNILVAQAATRLLGARRAVARVFEPARETTYRALGVETVCPTTLAAGETLGRIAASGGDRHGEGA